MLCTRVLAHVLLPGYINVTVELPLNHMNRFFVCDVSYGQVFFVGICITVACETVSCAEMYNEQTKAVGAGTSVNKENRKSKAVSSSSFIFLERGE